MLSESLSDKAGALTQSQYAEIFTGIRRGIEREALRIDGEGKLSKRSHPVALGSALTHPSITTDYAESLLEFITPVCDNIDELMGYLKDIHGYTLQHLDGEMLWPMSMPCVIGDEDDITLAQYGSSNVGQMKTIYREGLRNRYGSLMQIIAGVHFNFSLSEKAWPLLQQLLGNDDDLQSFRSDRYFSLIRNFKRQGWIIPYLFGASPALCRSFLKEESDYDFSRTGKGTLYLPEATSLRLSDLGYTNSAQAQLSICYNSIDNYLASVEKAIETPSSEFAEIGIKVDGQYRQLNSNVLQIENELYAPIRPKRVAASGQKPSEALREGGVEYIEVRSLDINPFTPLGIDEDQVRFLDLFLLHCLFSDDSPASTGQNQQNTENLDRVILNGRKAGLQLEDGERQISLNDWGSELFDELQLLAELFEQHTGQSEYIEVLERLRPALVESELTFSGRIMAELLGDEKDNGVFGMQQARRFEESLTSADYQCLSLEELYRQARVSLDDQQQIESADKVGIDQFLQDYFSK